jgi:MOSC domain-containing protein YiiM
MARILAVSAGRAAPLFAQDAGERFTTLSAIGKRPVSTLDCPTRCAVGPQGVEADESVERRIHGPPLQALYIYPAEHYEFWRALARQHHARPIADAGALGENLTVQGLTESTVWIGDVLTVGTVRMRITRPRVPCFKLNAHLGLRMAAKLMVQSGFTGYYCEVLQPGDLAAGELLELIPGARTLTVLDRHRLDTDAPQRALPF